MKEEEHALNSIPITALYLKKNNFRLSYPLKRKFVQQRNSGLFGFNFSRLL